MILTDAASKYFSSTQAKVRSSFAESTSKTPFYYEDEPFHAAYKAVSMMWKKRQSLKDIVEECGVSRITVKQWEKDFIGYGAIGLLAEAPHVEADNRLESLVVLIKSAHRHENASYALRLAEALKIPGATLGIIRRIQRSYGYGQRCDKIDREFYSGLQKIFKSVEFQKKKKRDFGHGPKKGCATFFPKDCKDSFQQKIELFKELSCCQSKRYIRPILRKYGIHQDRYYQLKDRFMLYGIWGLVDLVHTSRRIGEKISPELQLEIIAQRLMNPALSPSRVMEKLEIKCSRANVQKIYNRWGLSAFKNPVSIRGVVSAPSPKEEQTRQDGASSAKLLLPGLFQKANLKVNREFEALVKRLKYRKLNICNPGAIIIAPFIHQLGIIEALHTYGPAKFRTKEITNNIIVNIIRIIAGFPTINDFRLNSDLSVAIGAGLTVTPRKSRFYDSFDDLRFQHLQKLRNDLALRARELNITEGKEIAIDYHCDQSDSRYPQDKRFSKAPDKKGDLVYAHRPQIIWDSGTHSIINIAYCEGRSRGPTALYNFLDDNLFKIIDPSVIKEIYADSEYTGEKQLVYLILRSDSSVTMCLKQNKKIKKWKEETLAKSQWHPYGDKYRLASQDFLLSNGIKFRFVVKQNIENNEIRCFGSTHCDWSPLKILDSYHLRWPVETGIKDLIENYFLNKPTGTSPEKNETHYYCIMAARLAIDYFLYSLAEPLWNTPEGWRCVLSTVRTTLFSNQNCELYLNDSGDFQLTYLDGDPHGIKRRLMKMLNQKYLSDHWRVPWWANRALTIKTEDQFGLTIGSQISN